MSEYIVYKAENIENGFIYIGATSRCLEERKEDHIQKANKETGHQFQEAIATYGADAFKWEQIDTAGTINELADKERNYILEFSLKDKCYNNDCGGGFKKKIYQYDLKGSLLNEYDDLKSASRAISVTIKSISAACLGKIKCCKGFYWSYYLTDVYTPIDDKRRKRVAQIGLEGMEMQVFLSISEASKKTGIGKSSIAKVCRKENKTAGGYQWIFI